jgi:hypothetical protein
MSRQLKPHGLALWGHVDQPSQVQLDAIGCPCRHAGAEKIRILCPDGTAQRHRTGKYGPIISITNSNTLQRLLLQPGIQFKIH